jgi:hypothetical protein
MSNGYKDSWSSPDEGDVEDSNVAVQMLMNLARVYGWEPKAPREEVARFLRASLNLADMQAEVVWQHRNLEVDVTHLAKALGKSFDDIPDTGRCTEGGSLFEYFCDGGEGVGIVQSWIDALLNRGVHQLHQEHRRTD